MFRAGGVSGSPLPDEVPSFGESVWWELGGVGGWLGGSGVLVMADGRARLTATLIESDVI